MAAWLLAAGRRRRCRCAVDVGPAAARRCVLGGWFGEAWAVWAVGACCLCGLRRWRQQQGCYGQDKHRHCCFLLLQTLSAAVQSAETSAATVCEMCMNSCNDRTVVMPPCCSICAAAAAPCTHTHRAYNTHHMHARNSQSFALSYTSCSLVCLLLVLNYCGVAVVFFSLSCL